MIALPVSALSVPALLPRLRAALEGAGPALAFGTETAVEVPEGTAAVVTTSGSTGYPKAVVLSAAALRASAAATAQRIGEGGWVLALEPGYVAGLQVLVRSVSAGTDLVLAPGRFDPRAFVRAAAELSGARYTSLVPAQLVRLLDAAEDAEVAACLRGFERILVGGQALPARVRERAEAWGVPVVRTYGASETSGGCVYDGIPLAGVRVRTQDAEVLLSGPVLATGYLADPAREAAAFYEIEGERWYRTGDAGRVEDGRLTVEGRLDNVIVSGGVNVSLDRVERIVRALPGLAAAVVVAVPDERWGESSVVVVPRAEAIPSLAAVREAVAAELGAPARPARLLEIDAFPLLASGKPDRVRLRASASASASAL